MLSARRRCWRWVSSTSKVQKLPKGLCGGRKISLRCNEDSAGIDVAPVIECRHCGVSCRTSALRWMRQRPPFQHSFRPTAMTQSNMTLANKKDVELSIANEALDSALVAGALARMGIAVDTSTDRELKLRAAVSEILQDPEKAIAFVDAVGELEDDSVPIPFFSRATAEELRCAITPRLPGVQYTISDYDWPTNSRRGD